MNTAVVSGDIVSIKYTPTKSGSRLGIRVKRQWGDKPTEFWNVAVWNDNAEFLKDKVKEGMKICAIGYLSQFIKGDDTIVFVNATEVHPLGDWSNLSSNETSNDSRGTENRLDSDSNTETINEPEDDDGETDPFDVSGW